MVDKRELKKRAEVFERKAKYWGERIHKLSFSRSVPPREIEEREAKACRNYVTAGDAYVKLRDFNKAIQNYENATEYTTRAGRRKIQEKIDQLESLSKTKKGRPLKRGTLERNLGFAILSIGSFVMALFFISYSLTGYAIGGLTHENSRWISTSLFILGLVFAFFYFKNKK